MRHNIPDLKQRLITLHNTVETDLEACYSYESLVDSLTDQETLTEALEAGLLSDQDLE